MYTLSNNYDSGAHWDGNWLVLVPLAKLTNGLDTRSPNAIVAKVCHKTIAKTDPRLNTVMIYSCPSGAFDLSFFSCWLLKELLEFKFTWLTMKVDSMKWNHSRMFVGFKDRKLLI